MIWLCSDNCEKFSFGSHNVNLEVSLKVEAQNYSQLLDAILWPRDVNFTEADVYGEICFTVVIGRNSFG